MEESNLSFINVKPKYLYSKKNNIFVPICLGNRFFVDKDNQVTDNVKKYIAWALEHTHERVLVLVADKIQDTNYFVRGNSTSLSGSKKRVLKDGQEIKQSIIKLVARDFSEHQRIIDVISYQEYQDQDPYNHEVTHIIYKEFKNNPDFARAVIETVKTTKKDKLFSVAEYHKLADYILDEFALAYVGPEYNQHHYGLFIYPEIDSTVYLIENIQKGMLFPKLTKQLPERQVGVVVINETKTVLADTFYGNISAQYESLINSPEVNQQLHSKLVEIMQKFSIGDGHVLDLGCGPGNLKKTIQKSISRNFYFDGIDVSDKMLKLAKIKGYKKIIHGNIEEILPILPDNSYDYVMAISSLHFVKDIQTALQHIQRIARKGYIISLDEITTEYQRGFATVCDSPVYNHFEVAIEHTAEEMEFPGWVSPREKKPIQVRMVYKKNEN